MAESNINIVEFSVEEVVREIYDCFLSKNLVKKIRNSIVLIEVEGKKWYIYFRETRGSCFLKDSVYNYDILVVDFNETEAVEYILELSKEEFSYYKDSIIVGMRRRVEILASNHENPVFCQKVNSFLRNHPEIIANETVVNNNKMSQTTSMEQIISSIQYKPESVGLIYELLVEVLACS